MNYSTTTPVRSSGLAVLSLVFGIGCWLVLPFLGGLIAVICGHLARADIRRAPLGTVEGGGLALAGLILGYLHLALCALGLLLIFAIIALGLGAPFWHPAGW